MGGANGEIWRAGHFPNSVHLIDARCQAPCSFIPLSGLRLSLLNKPTAVLSSLTEKACFLRVQPHDPEGKKVTDKKSTIWNTMANTKSPVRGLCRPNEQEAHRLGLAQPSIEAKDRVWTGEGTTSPGRPPNVTLHGGLGFGFPSASRPSRRSRSTTTIRPSDTPVRVSDQPVRPCASPTGLRSRQKRFLAP